MTTPAQRKAALDTLIGLSEKIKRGIINPSHARWMDEAISALTLPVTEPEIGEDSRVRYEGEDETPEERAEWIKNMVAKK